jgi:Asp-tRNA(Asn)/Glu-tRNA(Gln) amidotransferase B subunit
MLGVAVAAYRLGKSQGALVSATANPTLAQMLAQLVSQGKISQAQADAIKTEAARSGGDPASIVGPLAALL